MLWWHREDQLVYNNMNYNIFRFKREQFRIRVKTMIFTNTCFVLFPMRHSCPKNHICISYCLYMINFSSYTVVNNIILGIQLIYVTAGYRSIEGGGWVVECYKLLTFNYYNIFLKGWYYYTFHSGEEFF